MDQSKWDGKIIVTPAIYPLAPSKLHQRMAIEHVVSHNIVNLQVVDCWPNSLHHTPQVLITQAMDEFQFEHLEPASTPTNIVGKHLGKSVNATHVTVVSTDAYKYWHVEHLPVATCLSYNVFPCIIRHDHVDVTHVPPLAEHDTVIAGPLG